MIRKTAILLALMILLAGLLLAQSNNSRNPDNRIGDDYAKAALRALIVGNQGGVDAAYLSSLLVEADVEASTPAEEMSLKDVNRILGQWFRSPAMDHQACYVALKANLKARNGSTPEACK